jgi:hypothetical protein
VPWYCFIASNILSWLLLADVVPFRPQLNWWFAPCTNFVVRTDRLIHGVRCELCQQTPKQAIPARPEEQHKGPRLWLCHVPLTTHTPKQKKWLFFVKSLPNYYFFIYLLVCLFIIFGTQQEGKRMYTVHYT